MSTDGTKEELWDVIELTKAVEKAISSMARNSDGEQKNFDMLDKLVGDVKSPRAQPSTTDEYQDIEDRKLLKRGFEDAWSGLHQCLDPLDRMRARLKKRAIDSEEDAVSQTQP